MASSQRPNRSAIRQVQALSDPVRMAMMRTLALRPSSAADLAGAHGVPLEKIRYQLKRLKSDGLVRVHGERPTRGTVERTYLADPRRAADHDAKIVAAASGARRRFQEPIVMGVFRELLESIRVGVFREHSEVIARVPLKMDARGHREVERILTCATEKLFTIREESLSRLEESSASPLLIVAALLHLEEPV